MMPLLEKLSRMPLGQSSSSHYAALQMRIHSGIHLYQAFI